LVIGLVVFICHYTHHLRGFQQSIPISDTFWPVNLVECELVIQQAEREDKPEQEWSAMGTNGRNGDV